MKKKSLTTAIFGIVLLVSINACKKKDTATPSESTTTTNNTNNNTNTTPTPTITPTGPGPLVTPPCVYTRDTVVFAGYIFPNISFYGVSGDSISGNWNLTGNGMNGDCTITFYDDQPPTKNAVYTVTSDPSYTFMASNQVFVSMVTGGTFSYNYNSHSGSVYVNIVNGQVEATFCDLTFSSGSTSTTFTASGKLRDKNY